MSVVQLKCMDGGSMTDVPDSGVTVVGRGPFLEITDKRVSRNHANLEVIDGKLFLTPIHVNPCFFKKGGEGSQKILTKDEKYCLEEKDIFGLLPDQLFFQVIYKIKPVNGDVKKEEPISSQTNGTKLDKTVKEVSDDDRYERSDNEKDTKKYVKKAIKSDHDPESSVSKAGPSTVTPPGLKEMALPLERKRKLPTWLIQAANSKPIPEKKKPSPKVTVNNKREPKAVATKPKPEETYSFTDEDEEAEVIPVKKQRGRPIARQPPPHDSFSEDDEPVSKTKPKPQHTVNTLIPGTRTPRRKDTYADDDDEPIGRKARARPPTPESFTPSKRPVRAAKYARGSYEDELSDESDNLRTSRKKDDEDSDFVAAEEDDSGSDWGNKKSSGTPSRKGKGKATSGKSLRSRRHGRRSRHYSDSDDYLDDYVPRLSKRRASQLVKSESEEDIDDYSPPAKTKSHGRAKTAKKIESEEDEEEKPKSKARGRRKAAPKSESESDIEEYSPKPKSKSRGRPKAAKKSDSEDFEEEESPKPKLKGRGRPKTANKSDSEQEESPRLQTEKRNDSEEDKESPAAKTKPAKPKKRKFCEFGKKCYRKNAAHFKDYCHPGDVSYDEAMDKEEEKPECPYGTGCFRTNTKHKEEFSHTVKPSGTKRVGRAKKDTAGKKSVIEGDEDDDGNTNTYDYNDSFLDNTFEESDESFADPADEDSDYNPESEDITGMVKEAKGFQKNKKMQPPSRSR